jgi:hypothetical protein
MIITAAHVAPINLGLSKEPQKFFIGHVHEIETGIIEGPVHCPVIVVDAMLMNIASRIP